MRENIKLVNEILVPLANTIVNDNYEMIRWYIPVLPDDVYKGNKDIVELLSDNMKYLVQFCFDYDDNVTIGVYSKRDDVADGMWDLIDDITDDEVLNTVREYFESQNVVV